MIKTMSALGCALFLASTAQAQTAPAPAAVPAVQQM